VEEEVELSTSSTSCSRFRALFTASHHLRETSKKFETELESPFLSLKLTLQGNVKVNRLCLARNEPYPH